MAKALVIFITCPSREEAQKISRALIEKKLAACSNLIDNVDSLFRWKGKIDSAKECLIMAKSAENKMEELIITVKSLHTYEVPEIIALPVVHGSPDYMEWIDGALSGNA